MKLLVLIGICSCLSGCALTLEMMAISGISYLATGKSLSDNAFSVVTNRDCALHRIVMSEAVCVENGLSLGNNEIGSILARSKITNTIETDLANADSIIDSAEDLSSDVVTHVSTVSIGNIAVPVTATETSSTDYFSVQKFAVVGSFNSYQYAQLRNEKYLSFNPQIITNQDHSATKYRVVVGPFKRSDFIAKLPVMVGAETQLPWEIDLCVDDMSPPPCNNDYAVNIHQQFSVDLIAAPRLYDTVTLR